MEYLIVDFENGEIEECQIQFPPYNEGGQGA